MQFASYTHTGYAREINEDSLLIPEKTESGLLGSFAVVADGMGGHRAGEVASAMAVKSMVSIFNTDDAEKRLHVDPASLMRDAMMETNERIYFLSKTDGQMSGMGTTMTAAIVFENQVIIGHLGDSRAYLYRKNGEMIRLTTDHSWVQELINQNLITEEEAFHHPQRNFLSKALGIQAREVPDIVTAEWAPGDRLVLCSDGLCGYVKDSDIVQCLYHEKTADECAWALGELALTAGGLDNVSVCVIDHTEGGAA